ncbi:FlaD/FlaE family flagellar protein [Halosimplex pelagicum]|uniref:Flagella E n=1 Tax=Halosimplex pelagicum TaxID=869886 RepID=A0A7D5SW72_9EURY|nr:FlaD/FlaE family flagellar protein [Halosimplex pelagicum]QLH82807.1 flagella E [Halosimplex pelagicum]
MTINPRDYDLNELREMARKRDDIDAEDPRASDGRPEDPRPDDPSEAEWGPLDDVGEASMSAGDSFRAGLYRELLPLIGGQDDLEKPYLRSVPDTYAAEFVVFEWLEFLLMHAGYKGAADALGYYESIDWITEDVAGQLNDYLLGIDETGSNEGNDLDVDDHMLSLVYVAKLTGMQ